MALQVLKPYHIFYWHDVKLTILLIFQNLKATSLKYGVLPTPLCLLFKWCSTFHLRVCKHYHPVFIMKKEIFGIKGKQIVFYEIWSLTEAASFWCYDQTGGELPQNNGNHTTSKGNAHWLIMLLLICQVKNTMWKKSDETTKTDSHHIVWANGISSSDILHKISIHNLKGEANLGELSCNRKIWLSWILYCVYLSFDRFIRE